MSSVYSESVSYQDGQLGMYKLNQIIRLLIWWKPTGPSQSVIMISTLYSSELIRSKQNMMIKGYRRHFRIVADGTWLISFTKQLSNIFFPDQPVEQKENSNDREGDEGCIEETDEEPNNREDAGNVDNCTKTQTYDVNYH